MWLPIKQVQGLSTALKTPFTVSEEVPQNPVVNQVWFQPSTTSIFVYLMDTNGPVWVEAAK